MRNLRKILYYVLIFALFLAHSSFFVIKKARAADCGAGLWLQFNTKTLVYNLSGQLVGSGWVYDDKGNPIPSDHQIVYEVEGDDKPHTYEFKTVPGTEEFLPKQFSVTATKWNCHMQGITSAEENDFNIELEKNPNYKPPTPPPPPTGGKLDTKTVTAAVDNPEAECPGAFTVRATGYENSSVVELSWVKPSTDKKASYTVYRGTDIQVSDTHTENYTVLTRTDDTCFKDSPVANGHKYVYRIQSYVSEGNLTCLGNGVLIDLTDPKNIKTDTFISMQGNPIPQEDDKCGVTGGWVTEAIASVLCSFIHGIAAIAGWLTDAVFKGVFNA